MSTSSRNRTAIQFIPNSPIPPSGIISRTLLTLWFYSPGKPLDLLLIVAMRLNQAGKYSIRAHLRLCYNPLMIKTSLLLIALAALLLSMAGASFAATETMRLDYYHSCNSSQELFSVDRIVIEPLPWPGDLSQSIDTSNLGKYFFEVRDKQNKRVLYSRGFASIYGEWETTDEAKTSNRTFQESLRFPAPSTVVEVVVKKRESKNTFQDIWTTVVDPQDQFVDRSKLVGPAPLITIQKLGEPETKA